MIDKQSIWQSTLPDARFLDFENLEHLEPILRDSHLLATTEKVKSIEKPGEGNMNLVMRITTNQRSFILKQSRPWVEKYPQIPAPVERLHAEAAYYDFINETPGLVSRSPNLLAYTPADVALAFVDLGSVADCSNIYQKDERLSASEIHAAFDYLTLLHRTDWSDRAADFPGNHALKKLNHEHIFHFPYLNDNGFDLNTIQPGLAELAQTIQADDVLKQRIKAWGEVYLETGPTLIHGDFYPGSWLRTRNGLCVIDPEFAHFGRAEFDIGVLVAHLLMANTDPALIRQGLAIYCRHSPLDASVWIPYCGIEILRRLIGLAQLPLDMSLDEKKALIVRAKAFIDSPLQSDMV